MPNKIDMKDLFFEPQKNMSPDFVRLCAHLMSLYRYCWRPENYSNVEKRLEAQRKQLRRPGNLYKIIDLKGKNSRDKSDAFGVLLETEKQVVLTFRGSGTGEAGGVVRNALSDARCRLVKRDAFPGRVHVGFHQEYFEIRDVVVAAIKETDYLNKEIIVSGFSLGSGIATLIAYDLQKTLSTRQKEVKPWVYLFAAPAVGNDKFKEAFNKMNSQIYHIAHEQDIVGQFPQLLFTNYRHPAEKLLVFKTDRWKSDEKSPDTVEQVHHKKISLRLNPELYLDALRAVRTVKPEAVPAAIATVVGIIVTSAATSFARFHQPDLYFDCMVSFFEDYDNCVNTDTNLLLAADEQERMCLARSIDLSDFLQTEESERRAG